MYVTAQEGIHGIRLEEKEEVGENVKSAVRQAMGASIQKTDSASSATQASTDEDSEDDDDDPMELEEPEMNRLRLEAEAGDVDALWVLENKLKIPKDLLPKSKKKAPVLLGFDDDDNEDSQPSSDEDSDLTKAV